MQDRVHMRKNGHRNGAGRDVVTGGIMVAALILFIGTSGSVQSSSPSPSSP